MDNGCVDLEGGRGWGGRRSSNELCIYSVYFYVSLVLLLWREQEARGRVSAYELHATAVLGEVPGAKDKFLPRSAIR